MSRRSGAVIGVLALSLLAAPTTAHAAAPTSSGSSSRTSSGDTPGQALTRLRSAAHGTLRVHRDAAGRVDHLSSSNGRAALPAPTGTHDPADAVRHQLATYGGAFGIDGKRSQAVVAGTLPSSTGGSIVRADQVVSGLPVFGGQVVTTLDRQDGVVSINAATTAATDVPAARVSRDRAKATAIGLVARDTGVPRSQLIAVDQGEHLYDPALVHTFDPRGVRPVWQFQVGNGSDVRELVLVGAERGEVALHFNQAPQVSRWVCDNQDARTVSSNTAVPVCGTAARKDSTVSSVADVNAAYDNLGEVADAYQQLDGIDLTKLIGVGTGSARSLTATVRWCYSDDTCPMDNAFWDGTQMVFGDGYAGADDVVGHELTHGYVQHTSNLFAYHQSGSLNESLADTIGEIVDHRNGSDDDSAWTVGESLPASALAGAGALRSMKDPTLYGQPDTMTSNLYASDPIEDNGDTTGNNDLGDVHQDDGVGNKTAYLISQGTADLPGGAFQGQSFSGIDGSDPSLSKTGRLYLETIPALTSGAQYADLGTTLVATCQRLAAAGNLGFTSSDCATVSDAVAATQLSTAPAGGPRQAPVACPTGLSVNQLARDDDAVNQFAFTTTSNVWGRDGSYAESGKTSL
ncbi:MAG: M4 family metallopeptidase, partial [Marmoricola sp.]|nr:M4 family metallopeptidase [Marmoricola sp.]